MAKKYSEQDKEAARLEALLDERENGDNAELVKALEDSADELDGAAVDADGDEPDTDPEDEDADWDEDEDWDDEDADAEDEDTEPEPAAPMKKSADAVDTVQDSGAKFLTELASDYEVAQVLDENPALAGLAAQIGSITTAISRVEQAQTTLAKSAPVIDPSLTAKVAKLEKSLALAMRGIGSLLEKQDEIASRPQFVTVPPAYGAGADRGEQNSKLQKAIELEQKETGRYREMNDLNTRFSEVVRIDNTFGMRYGWMMNTPNPRQTLEKALPDGVRKDYILNAEGKAE